jgi:predicted nucleic acid-binding protein
MARANIFLDTSALFAGIWSATGGANMLLKLGEAGAIQIWVSPQVLTEVEGAIRRKAPERLGTLALVLADSRLRTTDPPQPDLVARCEALTGYHNDALVLAAALALAPQFFVTLDREHFLDNARVRDAMPFPMGTPGDCLAWVREQLTSPD